MLAALAIMGLVVAVAAPSLVRSLEAAAFASKADLIARDIEAMRTRALLERRRFVFPGEGETAYAELTEPPPAGWTVEGGPVVFLDTGVCLGGALAVTDGKGRRREIELAAPDCRLTPRR